VPTTVDGNNEREAGRRSAQLLIWSLSYIRSPVKIISKIISKTVDFSCKICYHDCIVKERRQDEEISMLEVWPYMVA